jgi:hypothetical protein
VRLRKGMAVQELTKRVGQVPRRGKVLDVHDGTVEVLWDDGQRSSLSGGYLIPAPQKKR